MMGPEAASTRVQSIEVMRWGQAKIRPHGFVWSEAARDTGGDEP